MISRFHRLIAVSMALLLLVSSAGWSMDLHYCQGHLKGASFIGKAKTCHEKKAAKRCHKEKKSCHHGSSVLSESEKNACCQNRTLHVAADDTDKNLVSATTSDHQPLYPDLITLNDAPQVINLSLRHSRQKYRPPPPIRDFQALLQIFRL